MLSQRRGFCSTNYFVFSQVVITVTGCHHSNNLIVLRATCPLFMRVLAFCCSGIQGGEDKGENGPFQVSVFMPLEKTEAAEASPF